MTKTELSAALRKHCNGASFITRSQAASFFGVSEPRVIDKYLEGLERVSSKYYFIEDVSNNIMKFRN